MIEKNYTDEIIKKDYRKLTLKYHPDIHNGEENYNEIMKQINLAKEILLSSCKPPKNNDNTPPKSVSQIINTSDNDLTEILPAIRANASKAEQLRKIPQENVDMLHAIGMNRAFLPKAYGGLEMSHLYL